MTAPPAKRQRVVDAQEALDEVKDQLQSQAYLTIANGLMEAHNTMSEELYVLTCLYILPTCRNHGNDFRQIEGDEPQYMSVNLQRRQATMLIPLNERDLDYLKPMGVIRSCPNTDGIEWRRLMAKRGVDIHPLDTIINQFGEPCYVYPTVVHLALRSTDNKISDGDGRY
jgi:hypothetical protein